MLRRRAAMMPPFPGIEPMFRKAFAQLAGAVPGDVELGFHLCYGDMDAKHFIEDKTPPTDPDDD